MNLKKNNISGIDPQQQKRNQEQSAEKKIASQKMDYWLNSLLVNVSTRDEQDWQNESLKLSIIFSSSLFLDYLSSATS